MTTSPRKTLLTGFCALALLAGGLASGVRAAAIEPGLRLIQAAPEVTLMGYPGEGAYLDLGLYLAAENAPFEVHLSRSDYSQPVVVKQILATEGGGVEERILPSDVLDGWFGFAEFLSVKIEKPDGEDVKEFTTPFCPNNEHQRLNDSGPNQSMFVQGCFANPFTRGFIWGIEQGWAANLLGYSGRPTQLRRGRYVVTTSISPRYVDLLNIDPALTTATTNVHVKMYEEALCGRRCRTGSAVECHDEVCGSSARRVPMRAAAVPTLADPAPEMLPDLISLPAWGISVQNGRNRDRLIFGATVWAGGASPLVVEGFRRPGEDLMDAYQYFYENGRPVGRSPAGALEYDVRDGHDHWHFKQFAGYSLLGADQTEIVRSRKEAFCLAPTDAIDILIPDAERNPYSIGLGTACGGPGAIWIREILPLGWGDTYFQGLPGQSFNITDLPNGTYYIAVQANPQGLLQEQDTANNVELRQVILKGRLHNRKVEVPPFQGIDSESGPGFGGGGFFTP